VHEERDALARETLAPFEMSVPHVQLDARIESRDHECLGDDSLRIGRRGCEPSEQQGGHDSKMTHSIPLQTVNAFLASAIAIRRRPRAAHASATRTIPRAAGAQP
jgi:hypothetical protein